jgi:hypothetical protein
VDKAAEHGLGLSTVNYCSLSHGGKAMRLCYVQRSSSVPRLMAALGRVCVCIWSRLSAASRQLGAGVVAPRSVMTCGLAFAEEQQEQEATTSKQRTANR